MPTNRRHHPKFENCTEELTFADFSGLTEGAVDSTPVLDWRSILAAPRVHEDSLRGKNRMKVAAAFAWRVMLFIAMIQGRVSLADGDSLHTLIDQSQPPIFGDYAVRCSDAEFLRRVSLDLTGMPPTSDQARAFLADTSADKRTQLVDRLLASPHYARHLAATLDLMLMERRANTHVTADEWQAWLLKSVQENKPWNVLVKEILQADGDDPAQRAPARFMLDRGSEPHLLTRDIGRIFFGRDMQCAQCHDHPLVTDYLQSDYHGLLAFVAPGYAMIRKEGEKQVTLNAEKAGTDQSFESVFVGVPHRTGPRMPGGAAIEEPVFLPGEEYEVAPADNVKPVPKFSRRAKLAELATNGSNQAFNENIANRLWAHMFGRGLVHPLDMHHPDNPATNPELLKALAERFVAMNYDIRGFLREIALSETYQHSFDVPAELLSAPADAAPRIAELEQRLEALQQESDQSIDAFSSAADAWQTAESAWMPVAAELDAARSKYGEAKTKLDEAARAQAEATAKRDGKQSAATPLQQAAAMAKQAAQTIPQDAALAATATTLVARSQELAAEVAALTKAVEEKSAAVQPLAEAVASSKQAIETARGKSAPLKVAERQAEQAMLASRREAEHDTECAAALDRRLAALRQIAGLTEANQALANARQEVAKCETATAEADKLLRDSMAQIAPMEASVKSAADTLASAALALNTARSEHEKQAEAQRAIASAIESIKIAQQQLPTDTLLAETAAKLQERYGAAQGQAGQTQQQLDVAIAAHKAAEEALLAAQTALASATAQCTANEQSLASASEALESAKKLADAKQAELGSKGAELTSCWARNFTVASLKPLTPEQLCWSVFRVTGVYDRYWQAEVAELDKAKPLAEEQKHDPAQLAAREAELEQRTFDKLKGNVGTFVSFYGAAAGQPQSDFFSTADQALFSANGGAVNSWVAPAGDNVTDRIIKQSDLRLAAEELYLSILTRMPTDDETAEVVAYLSNRPSDKNIAAQELVWGLLNSAEFRFNH